MNTLTRKRLIDKLVEAYVDWREACLRLNDAYRAWASETVSPRAVAFGLYMAALDAEEQAAEVYAGLVRRADKLPWSQESPLEPLGGPTWGVDWQ